MGTIAFLGTPEIIIILVIALIVFGPQKLPEVGRQIGSAMRELRKVSGEVQRALDIDEFGGGGMGGYDAGRWHGVPAAAPPPLHAVAPVAGVIAAGESHEDAFAVHPREELPAEPLEPAHEAPELMIPAHEGGQESENAAAPETAAAH
jgi:TatA/E family protein of Tat protein translocase